MDRRSRPAFAGRRILAVAGLAVFAAGAGQTYGFSPFVEPMLRDLGFSRSLFSAIYAVATLVCAASLLPAGRLADRLGSRFLLAAAALALAVAVWLNSRAAGVFSALVAISLLRASGAGILPLASRTLVPYWFVRERGRAFSILGLAGTFSVALIPIWHQAVIDAAGWRAAWLADAAILVLLAPLIWFAVRDRPEDLGQLPDGDAPLDPHAARASAPADSGYTLAEAARMPAFWATGLAYLAPSMILTGLAFNQVALLGERGIPASFGALTFAVEAAISLPVTLATGWFVDRRPFRWSLALAQALIAVAIFVLLVWHSRLGATMYAALRGASVGLWLVSVDVAWPSWFGRRHVGAIRGAGTALSFIGAALGPLPFGLAHDATGSYDLALAALAVLPLAAAAWILTVRAPAQPVPRPD